MTDAENLLWSRVRGKQLLGVQFYRQKTIGVYIVDFYAPKANLVVEIDGSQHLEAEHASDDRKRDAYLKRQGLAVLRFNDLQVLKETEAVVEVIYLAIAAAQIPPSPPLQKGGKTARTPKVKRRGVADPSLQKEQGKNPPLKKGGRGDLHAQARNDFSTEGGGPVEGRGNSSGAKNHDEGVS